MADPFICHRCGAAFGALGLFDRHQDVDYSRPHDEIVQCRSAPDMGLVQDDRGVWQTQEGLAARRAAAERLRKPLACVVCAEMGIEPDHRAYPNPVLGDEHHGQYDPEHPEDIHYEGLSGI